MDNIERSVSHEKVMQDAPQKKPLEDSSEKFECTSDSRDECELEWATFLEETKREWANTSPGRTKRFAKYFYNRFIRLHGSEEQIAWGAALGFFVAMSPTMGFQMAIAIPLAAFFKISKIASAAACWITNPATAPFIYWVNYKLGAKLLGYPVNADFLSNPSWNALVKAGTHTILSLTVGGIITGVLVAVPGYFIALKSVRGAREKAARLRERKRRKKEAKKHPDRVPKP
jgi:uncharacterized protein (DUF2062 family)